MTERRVAAAWVPAVILAAAFLALTLGAKAPAPGGKSPLQDDEIVALLRDYLRIDTSNPPGNELKAARFFKVAEPDTGCRNRNHRGRNATAIHVFDRARGGVGLPDLIALTLLRIRHRNKGR